MISPDSRGRETSHETNTPHALPPAHQLAADLRATRRKLRRKTHELERSEAARLAAEEATERMTTFFADAAHDLRAPLTAIIGYSDLLYFGIPEPISDGSRERVRLIRMSAKHLVQKLNEMLDLILPDRESH